MKMSDMRAKARAIFGPAIAEPMPKQPNGAKALQERANARPIPTYKVGGAVKKNTPPQPTAAEREADRKRREEYAKMKVTKEQAAAIARGNRAADIEGGRYKTGGKVQTSADTAKKLATEMGGMKKGGKAKKDGLAVMIAIGSPMKGMKKPVKKMGGGMAYAKGGMACAKDGGEMMKPMKKAMGGAATKTPAPKAVAPSSPPRTTTPSSPPRTAPPSLRTAAPSGPPAPGPVHSEHKIPLKRQLPAKEPTAPTMATKAPATPPKPVKRAQGGAGKVRKGMMTPEGVITHAMNKLRGK